MAQIKNYGLIGVGSSIQLGKQGGIFQYNSSTSQFGFYDKTNTNLITIQAADPVADADVATKNYVDATAQGLSVKDSVEVASNGSNVIVGTPTALPLTIDGYTVKNDDRILLKDQTDASQNGIYVADITSATYTLERSKDTLEGGAFVFVVNGATNADSGFIISSPAGVINIGVDDISWTQFSSASTLSVGPGLSKVGSTIDLATDGTTIGIVSNKISVLSSTTSGQVLISSGTATESATYGTIVLSNPNSVSGVLPIGNGGTGLESVGTVGKVLISSGTALVYDYITTLYDSNGNKALQTFAATTPVNLLQISNASTGSSPSLAAVGTDDNIDISFIPNGTGEVLVPSSYTANIVSTNALITKSYVDTKVTEAVASATTPMLIVQEISGTTTPAFDESVSIGTIPSAEGKKCYITDVTMNVKTVLKTAINASITVGSNIFMDINSNDITSVGMYRVDSDYSYDASGMNVVVNFYSDSGSTGVAPTAGDIVVAVNYKFTS